MRKRDWVLLALVVSLVPTLALAQTQLTISPSQVFVFESQESFVRITGSSLLGSVSTTVVFDGPIRAENIPSNATSSQLDVWLPTAVAITAGQYSVSVVANDGTGTRTIGPTTFTVAERSVTGQPPQFTIPEVVVAEADNSTGAVVTFDDGGASCTHPSGSFFPMGTTSNTCSASNEFGTTSVTFTVVVTDTTPPVVTVPDDILQDSPVVTFSVSAVDNIDGAITSSTGIPRLTCFPASGSSFPTGESIVTCTAIDRHFNFGVATFKVTVSNTAPPVLSLPEDIEVEASDPNGAIVDYLATTSSGTLICTPEAGSVFPLGHTTVNCTATNDFGATSGSFNVTVLNTLGPTVFVPDDITAEATSAAGAAVSFTVTAFDFKDGNVAVTCTPASGSTFALGTTLVNCQAVDSDGNLGRDSFNVTVVDTTPPALHLPGNIIAEATSASGAAVSYTATATDLVDGTDPVTCSPASGSTFPLGTTTVNCTATDVHLNVSHGSFTVTVRDTTAPVIQSIDATPHEVLWPNNHKMQDTTVIVSSTDAVDPNPHAHIVSVTSDQPVNDGGDGDTSPDWLITGDLTVQLRSERTGGVDRHYTITVEVSDFSGNTSTGILVIVVHP
jgi:hypothetical protein